MLLKKIVEFETADSSRLHKHSGGQLTDVVKELHVYKEREESALRELPNSQIGWSCLAHKKLCLPWRGFGLAIVSHDVFEPYDSVINMSIIN